MIDDTPTTLAEIVELERVARYECHRVQVALTLGNSEIVLRVLSRTAFEALLALAIAKERYVPPYDWN
jgi:hypothetical protein